MTPFLAFITGLTTGGLSCLAVQGGLLASLIANQQKTSASRSSSPITPILSFLLAKLVSHTILGLLLGLIGSSIQLSTNSQLFFQSLTALFMLATAGNLLNLHPALRFLYFEPPYFVTKLIRNQTRNQHLFAPAVLGFLTVLIPCGVTQAIEVAAIQSAHPALAATIMFAFVLGTAPLFVILGLATTTLSQSWHHHFNRIAASILILMALYTLNGVLTVINSPFSFNNSIAPLFRVLGSSTSSPSIPIVNNSQPITINITNSGYSPNYFSVRANIPVTLTLKSQNAYSCALAFIFPQFDINTTLGSTDTQTFTFTPTQKGRFQFTCSMGMYSGIMEVI